jgi:hypothetical protein
LSVRVRIEPGDLGSLDQLAVDAVVLPFYEVRAQPRGPAGFVDWRLCGRLTKLLSSRSFEGKRGEAVLMGPVSRIAPPRILLFGLGPAAAPLKPELQKQMQELLKVAEDAKLESVALAPPEPFRLEPTKTGPAAPSPVDTVMAWLSEPALGRSKLEKIVLLDLGSLLFRARQELEKAAAQGVVFE